MVKEHRYVFEVGDINRIVYACPTCGQETSVLLEGKHEPESHCTACGNNLMAPTEQGVDPNLTLLRNLRAVRRVVNPSVAFRFVIPDPDVSG